MPDDETPPETAAPPRPPAAPAHLGPAGRKLWRAMVGKYAFEVWEIPLLEQACRQRDVIAGLEEVIRDEGLVTKGSTGQVRLHPAVAEARLGRAAFRQMMGQLQLPAEDGDTGEAKPLTARARRAQSAANHRWRQWRQRQGAG